jgi:UMF1 family MFS transporter
MQKNNPKVLNAWAMYDWSNSVYNLVITTAIFPVYYLSVTDIAFGGDTVPFFGFEFKNEALYGYAISFSFLLVALISPLLSGIADFGGRKKAFMRFFTILGALSCLGLFFFTGENIELGIGLAVLASVGYAGALVFYNAFLPEIATLDKMDGLSAKGFSLGYAGSVLLLIINFAMIMKRDLFGFDAQSDADALVMMRYSFLTVGIWWLVFSQYTFHYLKDSKSKQKITNDILAKGFLELKKVWIRLQDMSNMRTFLLSFFLYSVGVQTVILLAPTFAKEVVTDMGATDIMVLVIIIQLVAIPGAYLAAYLSDKKGNKFAIISLLFVWLGICVIAYFVDGKTNFYILGTGIGVVIGGIQSLSRSTYSKLIPQESTDTASFFSFYDVTEKLSIVLGTFLMSFVGDITGSMRNGILSMTIFFIIGIIIFSKMKDSKNLASVDEN